MKAGSQAGLRRSSSVSPSTRAGRGRSRRAVRARARSSRRTSADCQAQGPQAMSAGAAAGAAGGKDSRRDATTNYEVDKTVRVTRNAAGNIKRLTAAVVVNHRRVVGEDGKATQTALDAREIEQIQSLVREAIGFNKDRGDALNVVNAPFTLEDLPKPEAVPLWKDPMILSMARSIGAQLGLVVLGLIVIFGMIRPALRKPPAPEPARTGASTVVANDVALPAPSSVAVPGGPQEDLIRLARENPATVANVVRGWVNA
jgi:flagellar M-ring protein FliF